MYDLATPAARAALTLRREPYWTTLDRGTALGYRRGARGGTWIASWRDDDGRKRYCSLGEADDAGCGLSYVEARLRALEVVVASLAPPDATGEDASHGEGPGNDAPTGAITEAQAAALVEATRSRRFQPPRVDLAALVRDLDAVRRLYPVRLSHWRASRAARNKIAALVKGLRKPCRALAAALDDPDAADLLARAWQAETVCREPGSLASVVPPERMLAQLAHGIDLLTHAADLAQRVAEAAPDDERERIGVSIEHDFFGRLLPRLYKRHLHPSFGTS
jgi:hypothetical protein